MFQGKLLLITMISNISNLLSVVRYPIATPVTTSPCHLPPQKHSRPACLKRCALLLVSSPHSCPLAVPGDSPLRGSLSDRCANKCSLHPPPAALVCVARCIVHRTRFGGSPPSRRGLWVRFIDLAINNLHTIYN